MFLPEDRKMLVRGKVTAKSRNDDIIAYTHWYRHDDNLTILRCELEDLARCYMDMQKTDSIAMEYEYKKYL